MYGIMINDEREPYLQMPQEWQARHYQAINERRGARAAIVAWLECPNGCCEPQWIELDEYSDPIEANPWECDWVRYEDQFNEAGV